MKLLRSVRWRVGDQENETENFSSQLLIFPFVLGVVFRAFRREKNVSEEFFLMMYVCT